MNSAECVCHTLSDVLWQEDIPQFILKNVLTNPLGNECFKVIILWRQQWLKESVVLIVIKNPIK